MWKYTLGREVVKTPIKFEIIRLYCSLCPTTITCPTHYCLCSASLFVMCIFGRVTETWEHVPDCMPLVSCIWSRDTASDHVTLDRARARTKRTVSRTSPSRWCTTRLQDGDWWLMRLWGEVGHGSDGPGVGTDHVTCAGLTDILALWELTVLLG